MKGRRYFLLLAACGLAELGACSSASAPSATTLDLRLSTANEDDGAVLFTISGGPVDSIEAPGYRVYSARVDATTLRVVVAGSLRAGRLARIHLADDRQVPQYKASIEQVASRKYAQRDPGGYALTLAP